MPALLPLPTIIEQLEKAHGRPGKPRVTRPLELILWENVVYLADDAERQTAFTALRNKIGLTPAKILAASTKDLLAVTSLAGILPGKQAEKLRLIAQIARDEFTGDLDAVIQQPLAQARRSLKKFPGIGDPSADRILLFSGAYPLFPLESNGLRVLLRNGFGRENKNYAVSYRSVQEAVKPELQPDFPWLIAAHQLLRRHGQEVCRRTRPLCSACPLTATCRHYREFGMGKAK